MFDFLHSNIPDPYLIEWGILKIRWYGFLMVVGGLFGYWLILKLAKRKELDKKLFQDLLLYFPLGAIIGARIYYVFYAWEFYRNNLLDIFKIWEGGLAVHGIMIGGFIATYIYCKRKKISFWQIADLAVVGLAAAQMIGRAGNYFNQEIFGKPTDLAWGIPIEAINRPAGFESFEYFQPVFLYECFGSMLIAGLLFFLNWKKLKWSDGNIFLIYLIMYSAMRFGLEFLRIDYSPVLFGMRWPMIMSVLVFMVALSVLIYRKCRENKTI